MIKICPIVKKQHIIPHYYLKRFSNKDKILVYDKNSKKNYSTNINKISENYFYSSKEEQLLDPNNTEKYLSNFENKFSYNSNSLINEKKYNFDELIEEIYMFLIRGKKFRENIQLKISNLYKILIQNDIFNELEIRELFDKKRDFYFEFIFQPENKNAILKIFKDYLSNPFDKNIEYEGKLVSNSDNIHSEMQKFIEFFFKNKNFSSVQRDFLVDLFEKTLDQIVAHPELSLLEYLFKKTNNETMKDFLARCMVYYIIFKENQEKQFSLNELIRKIHEEDLRKSLDKKFNKESKIPSFLDFDEEIFTSDNPCFFLSESEDEIFYLLSPKKAIILSTSENNLSNFTSLDTEKVKKIIYENAIQYIYFKDKKEFYKNSHII